LDDDENPGLVDGEITLPGSSFSLELFAPEVSVRAASMTVPDALAGGSGDLHGDYMAPTGIDLTWTPPPAGVTVFTHVPMNHHVSTPAFTQCVVDGSAGALHIDGEMLSPLAVSTGL